MPYRYIVLLRGINVGGRNALPMASLRQLLAALGAIEIETYIQSGNAVFTHSETDRDALAQKLREAIVSQHGFAPEVWTLTAAELNSAIAHNPFPEAVNEPKTLHLFCLAAPVTDWDPECAAPWRKPSERLVLNRNFLYLHAPEGIGTSKLVGKIDRLLEVSTTARNWRTILKLREML